MVDATSQANPPTTAIRPSRYCRQCLYVLDGLPTPRCPECGTAYDPEDPSTYLNSARKPGHPWLYVAGALLSVPLLFCLAFTTSGAVFFVYALAAALALPHHFRHLRHGSRRWPTYVIFTVLCVLFSLQAAATILAWHTVGEVRQMLYFMIGSGSVVSCVLWRFRQRVAAIAIAALIAVVLVPKQVQLGYRLYCLQEEVAAMVTYLDSRLASHGYNRLDMSAYTYKRPWTSSFIACHFGAESVPVYNIMYWVEQRGISHRYDPDYRWTYHPD